MRTPCLLERRIPPSALNLILLLSYLDKCLSSSIYIISHNIVLERLLFDL